MNFLNKFQFGLKKTSSFLSTNIFKALSSNEIDQNTLNEIETILLSADIGIEVTNLLINKIQSSKFSNQANFSSILNILANELELILRPREKELLSSND